MLIAPPPGKSLKFESLELLVFLCEHDVILTTTPEGRLRVDAPPGLLTPDHHHAIRAYKDILLRFAPRQEPPPAPAPPPYHIRTRWNREKGWMDIYDPEQKRWYTICARGNPHWVYSRLERRR